MLSSRTVVLVSALILGPVSVARAQTVVGPSKCTACHDHDRQTAKWQKEEPLQYKDKAHYNTRKQLDGAKAGTYAKAIGIADPYDVKGSCVTCHATVFRGDANAGVSCESCHGPASGYLEPHQVKGSYAKAVSTGLRDLKSKPPAIAKACVACHLTTDKRLIAAGHPSGAEFDVGAGLKKVVHWDTTYDFASVTAAGKAAMGPASARAAAAPPAPPGGAAPAAPGGAPPPVKAGGRAPAAAPAAPSAASAPWDWNAPIRALPEDYKPEPVEPAEPAAAPAGGTAAPAAPRPARPAPPARVVPAPSLAEDLPVAPAIVATDAAALAPPPPPAAPAGPRSATARVAEARGGAALVLARVLRGGAKMPALPPAAAPKEFKGPDGELLRLQDEAIALALEALRRP